MILVANGCSHTAGAELEYPSQGHCYEKAWPVHLAKLFGYEDVVNLSESGASNHRVLRTTIEFIYQLIREQKNLKDYAFIINWPGIFRMEVYLPESEDAFDNGWIPILTANDEIYKKSFPKPLYNYYKGWTVYNDYHSLSVDSYMYKICLQNILSRFGCKFLFWEASNSALSSSQETACYRMLLNKNNFPTFGNKDYSFTSLCYRSNQNISKHSVDSGYNSHYDEDAQEWFAKFIYRYITKKTNLGFV